MRNFLIVGAGPSGLGCATALAAKGHVTLIDRIPVVGGETGWNNSLIKRYTRDAHQAGVHFRLGETALRWKENTLLVTGPGTADQLPGDHLFFAGGLCPGTAADLHIEGDRPAGVVAATVAEHLLSAKVRLWARVLILGDSPWARTVTHQCHELGTEVITVGPDPSHYEWPYRIRVLGRERVEGVDLIDTFGVSQTVRCDGIVLAAEPRPNRNIDGALSTENVEVTYLQPLTPQDPALRYEFAAHEARAWLGVQGEIS